MLVSRRLALTALMSAATLQATTVSANGRILDRSERLEFTAKVEEVYARRRAAAAPGTRVMQPDRAALGERVEFGLRAGAALARHFERPLAAAQVQREIDRMFRDSQRPDILGEIWAALEGDPWLFAEIVARPALAERLARSWFSTDRDVHRSTRATAQAALALAGDAASLRRIRGPRVETVSLDLSADAANGASQPAHGSPSLARIAEALGVGPGMPWASAVGRVSPLLEDDRSFYALGVVDSNERQALAVRATWDKQRLEDWLDTMPLQPGDVESIPGGDYRRPQDPASIAGAGCSGEGWNPISYMPEGRGGVAWVWTGGELVIWGGLDVILLNWGDRYDPATDRWTPMTTRGAPSPRETAFAAWTGTEVVIWGGRGANFVPLASGGRYDPVADTWRPTSEAGAPEARAQHRMVHTGSEVVVWGGFGGALGALNTGGRYDPVADAWAPTSLGANVPEPRGSGFAMVWSGSEVLVWGGCGAASPCELQSGGRYDPSTDTWAAITPASAPSARRHHAFTWTGTELFVWGGCQPGGGTPSMSCDLMPRLATGGLYNPATDSWRATSDVDAPHGRAGHTAVWSGSEAIVWGGCYQRRDSIYDCPGPNDRGRRYDPASNRWLVMNTDPPGLNVDVSALAVWTGSEMLLWRGASRAQSFGKRYSPASDSWVDMPPVVRPDPRRFHTAVWTGVEMIVWGGVFSNGFPYWGGASYDLALDQWSVLMPATWDESRQRHAAVWTGSEMIVWGGSGAGGLSANSGARWSPALRSWSTVSTVGAPLDRIDPIGVWTGTEMLLWGSSFAPGGRYAPDTNTWSVMSEIDGPIGRFDARGVWTGSELLVWGGWDASGPVRSGARYRPATDVWIAMSMAGAPSARGEHEMAWTGSEMVVFGGFDGLFQPIAAAGRYDPAADLWRPIAAVGEPGSRWAHGVAWNGSEVVVWGGCETFGCNDFGQNPLVDAAWDPVNDRWRPLPIRFAPEPRGWHSTVAAGEQILVWGGEAGNYSVPTGGIYCGSASVASPGESGQLLVARDHATGEIVATWSPSCAAAGGDYILYQGDVSAWDTWSPALCSTGGATNSRFTTPAGSRFFVVVPRSIEAEGGIHRPAQVSSCLPRFVASSCR